MTATWKTVRVFISSTFRDMHAERDHLVRFVLARPVIGRTLAALFEQLNEMEIIFPGTELVMHYSLLGSSAADFP